MFAGPICRVGAGNPPGGAMLWGSPEIIRNHSEDEPVTGWPLTMFETWEHHPSAQSKVEKPNFKSCRGLGENATSGNLWKALRFIPCYNHYSLTWVICGKKKLYSMVRPKNSEFSNCERLPGGPNSCTQKISNRQTWRDMIHARQLAGWWIRPLASTTSTSPDLDPWPQIVQWTEKKEWQFKKSPDKTGLVDSQVGSLHHPNQTSLYTSTIHQAEVGPPFDASLTPQLGSGTWASGLSVAALRRGSASRSASTVGANHGGIQIHNVLYGWSITMPCYMCIYEPGPRNP